MNFKKYIIPLVIFFVLSISFYILYYWIVHQAGHGADGLSGFFEAIITGILFIISLIGFIIFLALSILSNQGRRIQLIAIVVLLASAIFMLFTSLGGLSIFGI